MGLAPPKQMPPEPKIQRISVDNWRSGVVSAYDDGRMPIEGLLKSTNTLLDQDGVVRPRPGLKRRGPQPVGKIKGEIFQYRKVSGVSSSNWWISLQEVDGETSAYIAQQSHQTWTKVTGKTYDNDGSARFCQVRGAVLIVNGKDTMSLLDISTDTVIPFIELAKPGTPNATATGLSGSNYDIYYAITANSTVGETEVSDSKKLSIGTARDVWNKDTMSVKVTWPAVTDADSYNVYCGVAANGSGEPKMYAIATGLSPDTLEFTDNGTAAQNEYRPAPKINSTAGPVVSGCEVINGKVWLTGDVEEPYNIRYGGDYDHELDFSPANGGGFTPVGNGTKELPIKVLPFRDGKGTPQITVLCQGLSGQGKRYLLTPNSITVGNTSINFFSVTEDNGKVGTNSPDGVVMKDDSLYYPSSSGFKTTGTKPQLQNLLSTDGVSDTILTSMRDINESAMDKAVGLEHENRIYWALPVGSSHNNQVWVLDLQRGGAWMKPWTMEVDWMWLSTGEDGKTYHMVLSNNVIYCLSYDNLTQDDSQPFPTDGSTGQIAFSKDRLDWADLIQATITFLRPKGIINVALTAKNDDGETIVSRGVLDFSKNTSAGGWTDPLVHWTSPNGWTGSVTVPEDSSDPTVMLNVEVDEVVQWFQFSWNTTEANTDYSLAGVVAQYVSVGLIDD